MVLPEPVTKVVAVALTAYLIAYVGGFDAFVNILKLKTNTGIELPAALKGGARMITLAEGVMTVGVAPHAVAAVVAGPPGGAIRPAGLGSGAAKGPEGLRPVENGVWESAAGLRYGSGSAEGNRVLHILEHAADIPTRAGAHGVFSGGRSSIIGTIDDAYRLAQSGGSGVSKVQQGTRTIYTVDMAGRWGLLVAKRERPWATLPLPTYGSFSKERT